MRTGAARNGINKAASASETTLLPGRERKRISLFPFVGLGRREGRGEVDSDRGKTGWDGSGWIGIDGWWAAIG